jgi:serine/threonine-protein kinase
LADLQSFALTQIPPSKFDKIKPYLFFGMAAGALLLGFTAVKLLSTSTNKPQLSPPVSLVSSSPASKNLAPTTSNKIGWQTYLDPAAKVKIKYYPTWQLEDMRNLVTGENVMLISPQQSPTDNYRENVSVRVENLTNSQTSLADYTKSAIAEIGKYYKEAKIIESSSILLSKKPANLVVYTGKDENAIPIKNLEVWTIDRGKAYILTYKAEPDRYYTFLQTVMTMINSFELGN